MLVITFYRTKKGCNESKVFQKAMIIEVADSSLVIYRFLKRLLMNSSPDDKDNFHENKL